MSKGVHYRTVYLCDDERLCLYPKGEHPMIREGAVRIPSGCAVAAVISREGRRISGETIIEAMKPMHERSNGLGGGFAAYGIYYI